MTCDETVVNYHKTAILTEKQQQCIGFFFLLFWDIVSRISSPTITSFFLPVDDNFFLIFQTRARINKQTKQKHANLNIDTFVSVRETVDFVLPSHAWQTDRFTDTKTKGIEEMIGITTTQTTYRLRE